ncbi:hypothetical protein ABFA07_003471 [Porites harrisoni]
MSDRTRRTTWKGIKKNLKKPFVRKREKALPGFASGKGLVSTSDHDQIPKEPFVDEALNLISFDDEAFVSTYGNVESPQERSVDEALKLFFFDDEAFVSTYGNVESPQGRSLI